MGSHHCAAITITALVQQAVIVSLVLGLGPRDGEGRFVARDGAREVSRDPRILAACAVDKQSGSLAWGLLVPAGQLLVVTDPELSPQVRVTVSPGDTGRDGFWATV